MSELDPTSPVRGVSPLASFDWHFPTRVVFGPGTLGKLGELTRELGSRRPLLVTDPGIRKAGHVDRALAALTEAGLAPIVFDQVEENPTSKHVENGVAFARSEGIDLFVGLGGGSAMDTAKGINFVLTNGGSIRDYWGIGKATRPMLDLVAIPTTAGTGSEAQSFALISDDVTHQKMACGDKKAAAKVAILDPELTLSQPDRVTAICGIDALAHAAESWVTTAGTPISNLFAREAWRILSEGFPRVSADPSDLDARARMLLGAHYAGCAIEMSMLGATHSAANPLTAHFGITHGLAIGIMLPHVIRFNSSRVEPRYAELATLTAGLNGAGSAGERLAAWVTKVVKEAGLAENLRDSGVTRGMIPTLAEEAAKQWTARFNPRPLKVSDFEELYLRAYDGVG